jgi:hypothetical protein
MKLVKMFTLLAFIFVLGSCDKVEEAIESVTFKVTVVNNTSDQLTVFWNVDNQGFKEAGKVSANGGTLELNLVTINTDNVIEVRKDDGTVVGSGSYNQPDDTDRTLTVG